MLILKSDYYRSNYLATVSVEGDTFTLLGGMTEKRKLKLAKRETNFCYVKDLSTQSEVKLILKDSEWVVDRRILCEKE